MAVSPTLEVEARWAPQMLPAGQPRTFDSVGHVLAEGGKLPPLGEDDAGRQRNWIFVTGEPGFFYWGEFVEIDADWIDKAITTYETMGRSGYEAPVLAEHDSTVTEGRRLGDIVRLAKVKLEGRWAMVAEVRWANADAHEQIESGQIRYFSPAIASIEDDQSGDVLENVIAELSVVAAPHQKGGTTHVLAKEARMAEEEALLDEIEDGEDKNTETTVEDRLDELAQAVESLAMIVKALAEDGEEDEEEDTEEEEAEEADDSEEEDADDEVEMAEVKALKVRLGQLELQRDQAVYRRDVPVGSTFELTQAVADILFSVWRRDGERFKSAFGPALKHAVKASEATIDSPWAGMLGEGPGSTEGRQMTDTELHKQCLADCDGDANKASKLYYSQKYGV